MASSLYYWTAASALGLWLASWEWKVLTVRNEFIKRLKSIVSKRTGLRSVASQSLVLNGVQKKKNGRLVRYRCGAGARDPEDAKISEARIDQPGSSVVEVKMKSNGSDIPTKTDCSRVREIEASAKTASQSVSRRVSEHEPSGFAQGSLLVTLTVRHRGFDPASSGGVSTSIIPRPHRYN